MTVRRVAWLLAAGVVLVAFAIWLSSQRHLERATLAGDLVLPGLEQHVNAVTQVTLRKGDGTLTTLNRDSAGWSVAERGWPADLSKLRKLLLDLGALNIVEEKTRLPANYPQLGVEDLTTPKAGGTRVEVVAPTQSWALIVGKSSSAKSGYVRVASAAPSLLAAPLITLDADPKGWLDRTFVDLSPERVREVEERPASGPGYQLSRAKKEQSNFTVSPIPKGRELTAPGVADSIAGALSALGLDDVRKGASADPQATHATFRTFDGLELEVTGRKDGSRALLAVHARSGAKDTEAEAQKLNARLDGWEFEVPDYKYTAIFRPLEELLKKPPEPPKKPAKPAKAAPPAKSPPK